MLLAINFSTQAAVLQRLGALQIDRFKCPEWPALIAEAVQYCPVAIHFSLSAGRGRIFRKDLDEVEKIAQQTGTPFINLHLESKRQDFPEISPDSVRPAHRERIFRQMLEEVQLAIRRFGSERVIVENVPYRLNGNVLKPSADPEIIARIAHETNCGFLLDIPHARIAALSLGIDEREYMAALPIQNLKELHFTGVQNLDGWLQDHVPAQAADWQALDWVLARIQSQDWPKPWMLALEYSGVGEKFNWRSDAQMIAAQCAGLRKRIGQI